MRILVNQIEYDLPSGSFVSTALTHSEAQGPFAVAVNRIFVPKNQYLVHRLHEHDEVEIITPVTGG
jgi:sulfur carrier protein